MDTTITSALNSVNKYDGSVFSICLQTIPLTASRLVELEELFVFITAIKKGNALMYSTLLAIKL